MGLQGHAVSGLMVCDHANIATAAKIKIIRIILTIGVSFLLNLYIKPFMNL